MAKPNETVAKGAEETVTLSLRVGVELAERIRNAVFWTPGSTLVSVGQSAFEREIDRMERANGGAFKPRTQAALSRGRRPR